MEHLIWILFLLLLPFVRAGDVRRGKAVVPVKYNHNFTAKPSIVWRHGIHTWNDTNSGGRTGGNITAVPYNFDREYHAYISFGTKPQYMPVEFDTASADVWVYSSDQPEDQIINRTHYHPDQSTTATRAGDYTWYAGYMNGETAAQGVVYQDTINVAGIELEQAAVQAANYTTPNMSMVLDLTTDGFFGLAYNSAPGITPADILPSATQTFLSMIDSNVFTINLKWRADSEFSFGWIDHTMYKGPLIYTPVNQDSPFWTVNMTSAKFGHESTRLSFNRPAMIHTGTSLVMLPDNIVEAYYKLVPNSGIGPDGWQYPCGSQLPELTLGIGSGPKGNFTIPAKYMDFAPVDEGNVMCLGGLQADSSIPGGPDNGIGVSVLGSIFLKAVFAVFDKKNDQVGFAMKEWK